MTNPPSSIEIPKLDKFLSIPLPNIQVQVTSYDAHHFSSTTYAIELFIYSPRNNISNKFISQQKYKQFKIFYDGIIKKLPNIKLPEFPPKTQLVGKHETRLKYFNSLLKTIYDLVKNRNQDQNILMSSLYEFIFTDEKLAKSQIPELELKKIFKVRTNSSTSQISSQLNSSLSSAYLEGPNLLDQSNGSIGESLNKDIEQRKTDITNKDEKVDKVEKVIPTVLRRSEKSKSSVLRKNPSLQTEKEEDESQNEWSDVRIKSNLDKDSPAYIKIVEQSLQVFQSSSNNQFFLFLPLYKINYDIFRVILPNTKTNSNFGSIHRYVHRKEIMELDKEFPNATFEELDSEICFRLYHDFDSFNFYVTFSMSSKVKAVANFIKALDSSSNESSYISTIDKTNMNICGNLYIKLYKLFIDNYQGKCMVKIELQPYTFKTKVMLQENEFDINQSFILPIHNRFIPLVFGIYKVKGEGLVSKKSNEEKVGEYSIELPQLLNNFYQPNEDYSIYLKEAKIRLIFQIKDFSSFLSLISKNKNKKIIEDFPLENEVDDKHYTASVVMKRVKLALLFFRELEVFWDNLFRFKYPVFSGLIMVLSILYFTLCRTQYLLTHILVLLAVITLAYSKFYKDYISKYANKYIFQYKNPLDEGSKLVVTKDEQERLEMRQSGYIIGIKKDKDKDKVKKKKKSIGIFQKIKEYKNDYMILLYRLSKIVATIEKFKNLFLWTDPVLTFYFFSLIVFALLIVYNLELRYIMLISFTKKFIKGMFYYKDKNKNNIAVARILLKGCYRTYIKKSKKNILMDFVGDISEVSVEDEKMQEIIIEAFDEDADVDVDIDIFKRAKKMKDIIEEAKKCEEMLCIKKTSPYYQEYRTNQDIFIPPLEPEDVFYYYCQNIKSDYYLVRHNLDVDEEMKEEFAKVDEEVKKEKEKEKKKVKEELNIRNEEMRDNKKDNEKGEINKD